MAFFASKSKQASRVRVCACACAPAPKVWHLLTLTLPIRRRTPPPIPSGALLQGWPCSRSEGASPKHAVVAALIVGCHCQETLGNERARRARGTVDSELTAMCTLRSVDGCVIARLIGDGMGDGDGDGRYACRCSLSELHFLNPSGWPNLLAAGRHCVASWIPCWCSSAMGSTDCTLLYLTMYVTTDPVD